ncbi:RNA polymerase sigma24 factor [Acrocarpospora phusangensis]|uniref:RNA polymerase sigma24 factor n=1 Tax=Acrocarpospora phusangensis TaxID=1070424 RepID=A0A919UTW8_9ACTN|nr:SigE family RNA polymerase sigma factor [Acrocarpospora phusangensis]GIH27830.1 RNA polymerase sigma24 factor [Acrocarpospora phusangensis]
MPAPSAHDAEFTEYVSAKASWLRQVAFLLCGDWHRADEVLQIAITRLYVNWPRVRAAGNADGYARTVLVNVYLAERRSPWTRRVVPLNGQEEPPVTDGDLDSALDLRRALARLPARQRAILVLRYYCDLSVEETARTLRCSQGNVKSQTARGIDRLRRMLDTPAEEVWS